MEGSLSISKALRSTVRPQKCRGTYMNVTSEIRTYDPIVRYLRISQRCVCEMVFCFFPHCRFVAEPTFQRNIGYCLCLQGLGPFTVRFSETLSTTNESTRCENPEHLSASVLNDSKTTHIRSRRQCDWPFKLHPFVIFVFFSKTAD